MLRIHLVSKTFQGAHDAASCSSSRRIRRLNPLIIQNWINISWRFSSQIMEPSTTLLLHQVFRWDEKTLPSLRHWCLLQNDLRRVICLHLLELFPILRNRGLNGRLMIISITFRIEILQMLSVVELDLLGLFVRESHRRVCVHRWLLWNASFLELLLLLAKSHALFSVLLLSILLSKSCRFDPIIFHQVTRDFDAET